MRPIANCREARKTAKKTVYPGWSARRLQIEQSASGPLARWRLDLHYFRRRIWSRRCREVREHPQSEFMRRDGALGVLRSHVSVFGVVREIEQADGETLIVDAVEDHRKVERVGADDGVA